MLQSYSFEEKDTEYVQNTLMNIKEKVENKLILLINHVFSDSCKDFCDCLRMEYDNSEIQAIYGHLTTLKDDMLNYSVEDLPEPLLEEFAQVLLSTNKLKDQINKLIIKNFGN